MPIFALRKEVEKQRLQTLESAKKLEHRIDGTKANFQKRIAKPDILVGSFAAGVAAGWVGLERRAKRTNARELEEVTPQKLSELDNPTVKVETKPQRKSAFANMSDQLMMVATSVLAAKLNEKLNSALKDV